MEKNEIEFIDYLSVIWKRKWLIVIPTFICVIVAGFITFLLPEMWEIDTLIQPGKIFVRTEEGVSKETIVGDLSKIAGQINQTYYNSLIASDLNIDVREISRLKAQNLQDTNILTISVREKDVKKAKLILDSLFNHVKKDLDADMAIEIEEVENHIKEKEREKSQIDREVKADKNKLNIFKQRKREIENEVNDNKKRIEIIEKEQRLILKNAEKSQTEGLAMFFYSNEIQQSLRYLNTLKELLSGIKMKEEDMKLEINSKEEKAREIENEIKVLNESLEEINYTKLIKEPASSVSPIAPRKKLIVLIAGVLGLIMFTFLSFFLEYVEKQKDKRRI